MRVLKRSMQLDGRECLRRSEQLLEPGPGECLVRVRTIGICSSDCRNFLLADTGYFGHEVAGEVVIPGDGFTTGERVVVMHRCGCMTCEACRRGLPNLCSDPYNVDTGFTDYILLPAGRARYCLYAIPAAIGEREAAFIDSVACTVHAASLVAPDAGTGRVLVTGNGFMAYLLGFVLRDAGWEVVIYGRSGRKGEFARFLGLCGVEKEALAAARGEYDLCVDTTGDENAIASGLSMVRPGGGLLCFSRVAAMGRATLLSLRDRGIRMRFAKYHTPADVMRGFALVAGGVIPLGRMIMREGTFGDLESIIRDTLEEAIIRGVVYPEWKKQ